MKKVIDFEQEKVRRGINSNEMIIEDNVRITSTIKTKKKNTSKKKQIDLTTVFNFIRAIGFKKVKLVGMFVMMFLIGVGAFKLIGGNSPVVFAEKPIGDTYYEVFNEEIENKYSKALEGVKSSETVKKTAKKEAKAEQNKPTAYFAQDEILATLSESYTGEQSVYDISVTVSIDSSKISIDVSDSIDVKYNEKDIEIVEIKVDDNFNREYLADKTVDKKTIKKIESLIEKEKKNIVREIKNKDKKEFMAIIDKQIRETILVK